ncbi:MAG: hypothetical protein R3D34_10080 [Nitratireductor sp.]
MNAHTVQTCNNAKAAGVTVFTIAFDVRDGSSVKEMLNACAGSGVIDGEPVLSSGNFLFRRQWRRHSGRDGLHRQPDL